MKKKIFYLIGCTAVPLLLILLVLPSNAEVSWNSTSMTGDHTINTADSSPERNAEHLLANHTVCPAGPPACDYDIIQDAVDAAIAGDVIKVATGIYTDVNNHAGLAQILYLEKSVTIQGGYDQNFTEPPDPQANPTILDAQGGGRVVFVDDATPVLAGLTLTGGDATGLGGTYYGDDAGGGVYIWGGAPVISDSVISFNHAPMDGGGIFMRMFSGAQLINNDIYSNTANFGGGIYVWYSYPSVTGNLFASNVVTYAGGGVWLGVNSSADFERNLFTQNRGDRDTNVGSGGMLAERCTLTMEGNIFQGNVAAGGGSGLNLIRCQATLTNNLFADNEMSGIGGGLSLIGTNANLIHNTFARNHGGTPSGIYLGTHWEPRNSYASLINTIIVSETVGIYAEAGNQAILEATLWGSGAWANEQDWSGEGTILAGTTNIWEEPHFWNPEAGDYHLGPASAAIDAGITTDVFTDIDEEPRPNGIAPDLGADEYYDPLVLRAVVIAGPDTGLVGKEILFVATVDPVSATLPIFYTWQAANQIPVTHTGGISDSIAYTWHLPGIYTLSVSATNPLNTVYTSAAVTIVESSSILYLPVAIKP